MNDTLVIVLIAIISIGSTAGVIYLLTRGGKNSNSTRPISSVSATTENRAVVLPRSYKEWRKEEDARKEDAAYSLAYYVIKHCRDEVIEKESKEKSQEIRQLLENTVDSTLSSLFDLAEGFFKMRSGEANTIELVMTIRVKDGNFNTVEEIEISPGKIDLPIGYWKWAHERNFRSGT